MICSRRSKNCREIPARPRWGTSSADRSRSSTSIGTQQEVSDLEKFTFSGGRPLTALRSLSCRTSLPRSKPQPTDRECVFRRHVTDDSGLA